MSINLITSLTKYKGKYIIGSNNDLFTRIPEDLKYFKTITSNIKHDTESKIKYNVVVMGRKTWFSIPIERRPLSNRINIILTNNKNLRNFPLLANIIPNKKIFNKDTYFFNMSELERFYKITNADIFIIGGSEIYNLFISHPLMYPRKVYITEVNKNSEEKRVSDTVYTYFQPLSYRYSLTKYSKLKRYLDTSYRFLEYINTSDIFFLDDETKYLSLCREILNNGNTRPDRTDIGTIGIFGSSITFDISERVPLMTTKKVPYKSVIEELLWFCRGDTDTSILSNRGVKIWDGNTTREFLDNRGLYNYQPGILGPGYGWQWRFFGADYSQGFADTRKIDSSKMGGFDQLDYIVNELRNNPYSRRLLVSAWNPVDNSKTALPPCHYSFQFYVESRDNKQYLNCIFNMRSTDVFLGLPFNIFSYTVLTYIISAKCDMYPGKLIYSGADVHIYQNHIEAVETQLSREPRSLPALIMSKDIKYKDWSDISVDDFELVGYFPHNSIKAPMAV